MAARQPTSLLARSALRLASPAARPSHLCRPLSTLPARVAPAPSFRAIIPQHPRRHAHTIPKPPAAPQKEPGDNPNAPADTSPPSDVLRRKQQEPHYQLTFTCVPCSARSTHTVSKQGYHAGSVLITCPSCRNRHIISDHLDIFGNKGRTVEDILREKGELVKRGTLGEDGDVEFWPADPDHQPGGGEQK